MHYNLTINQKRTGICCCSRVRRAAGRVSEVTNVVLSAQSHLHLQFEQQLTNKIARRDPELVLFLEGNRRCLPYAPHTVVARARPRRPLAVVDGFSSAAASNKLTNDVKKALHGSHIHTFSKFGNIQILDSSERLFFNSRLFFSR